MSVDKPRIALYTKLLACLIAISIVALLILSGPAQPINVGLDIQNPVVQQGEDLFVEASADILTIHPTDINFIIRIGGPKNLTCFYNAKGQKIKDIGYETQCNHIQIKRDNPDDGLHGYGYGYGYGYEEGTGNNQLSLHIKMNTNQFPSGQYVFSLLVLSDGNNQEVDGQFEVTPGSTGKHNYDI